MDIRFSDVTSPYYDEAQIASVLFSDFNLPLKPYKEIITLLFKFCKKELKRTLKLSNSYSKEETKVLFSDLRRDFCGFKSLKRDKPLQEDAAVTAGTLPSVMPVGELSLIDREPLGSQSTRK